MYYENESSSSDEEQQVIYDDRSSSSSNFSNEEEAPADEGPPSSACLTVPEEPSLYEQQAKKVHEEARALLRRLMDPALAPSGSTYAPAFDGPSTSAATGPSPPEAAAHAAASEEEAPEEDAAAAADALPCSCLTSTVECLPFTPVPPGFDPLPASSAAAAVVGGRRSEKKGKRKGSGGRALMSEAEYKAALLRRNELRKVRYAKKRQNLGLSYVPFDKDERRGRSRTRKLAKDRVYSTTPAAVRAFRRYHTGRLPDNPRQSEEALRVHEQFLAERNLKCTRTGRPIHGASSSAAGGGSLKEAPYFLSSSLSVQGRPRSSASSLPGAPLPAASSSSVGAASYSSCCRQSSSCPPSSSSSSLPGSSSSSSVSAPHPPDSVGMMKENFLQAIKPDVCRKFSIFKFQKRLWEMRAKMVKDGASELRLRRGARKNAAADVGEPEGDDTEAAIDFDRELGNSYPLR